MFLSTKKLSTAIQDAMKMILDESEVVKLRKEIKSLKEAPERLNGEIADLKLQREVEERKLKHLVKMKEEKDSLEMEKKTVKMEREFSKKEMALQTKYFDDKVAQLKETEVKFKELYTEILQRLPNVNMEINKDISREEK